MVAFHIPSKYGIAFAALKMHYWLQYFKCVNDRCVLCSTGWFTVHSSCYISRHARVVKPYAEYDVDIYK